MKTIAFSDLHGNYELWTAIKNYYNDNDTLIFLGDACDRGPDGIKIMQEMFKDKRVIYLLGNHEQMLLDYYTQGIEKSLIEDEKLINYNGCQATLNSFKELTEQGQIILIDNLLNKTKISFIYINKDKKNIFLSHAGTDVEKINAATEKTLLWDRQHIKLNIPFNEKTKYWYIVHGHTPVQSVIPDKTVIEILRYYNKHKIDIDLGTPNSNMAAALDLDTLQVKYFYFLL